MTDAQTDVTAGPTRSEPLLALRGLIAGYDGVSVVHDLDLTVGVGEVVALVGANGAGKTTTLLTVVEGLLPVLRSIADETGAGILVVEQHVGLVLTIADRAFLLSRGRATFDGPAAELADRADLIELGYLGDAPA
ncbi:MAG: ATP-binding cassette domain-containing protein [Iamia sp.]